MFKNDYERDKSDYIAIARGDIPRTKILLKYEDFKHIMDYNSTKQQFVCTGIIHSDFDLDNKIDIVFALYNPQTHINRLCVISSDKIINLSHDKLCDLSDKILEEFRKEL